jgi:hypothetical protein
VSAHARRRQRTIALAWLAVTMAAGACTTGQIGVPADGVGAGGAAGVGGSMGGLATGKTATVDQIGGTCASTRMAPPLLRRLGMREFSNTVRAAFTPLSDAGADWNPMITVADDTLSSLRLGGDAAVLLVGSQTAKEILASAESIAGYVTAPDHLPTMLPCAASAPGEACAATFITDTGTRLFRRQLTSDEKARYLDNFRVISARSNFATGLRWTLVAMLQSPSTLYRSEIGTRRGDGYELAPSEIASQLSYDFGGGPPSSELLARADSGGLADPAARVEEARRLLLGPGGHVIMQQFFQQWSHYPRVIAETRTVDRFDQIRVAMTEETQRFVDEIVINRRGGIKELLTAPVTVLNPALAQFYGYGAGAGDWAVVDRPTNAAVGLLAQGSILAGNAHIDSSSPTLRGLLVFERLLCNPRSPPPPNVPRIEIPSPGVKTTRQRYEETHAKGGSCPVCHTLFDPIGFASEQFDEVGRFRSNEAGLPINATGSALGADGTTRITFDGLADLAQKLAGLAQVSNCIGGFIETMVFGGGGGNVCLASEQRQQLVQGKTGLLDFTAALAASPNFVRRAAP